MGNEIRPEQYFSLCTGILLKDIEELAFTLDYMSEDEFRQHVNKKKNDFSCWIKDVFKEKSLAEEIARAHEKKEIQIALLKYLVKKR